MHGVAALFLIQYFLFILVLFLCNNNYTIVQYSLKSLGQKVDLKMNCHNF